MLGFSAPAYDHNRHIGSAGWASAQAGAVKPSTNTPYSYLPKIAIRTPANSLNALSETQPHRRD